MVRKRKKIKPDASRGTPSAPAAADAPSDATDDAASSEDEEARERDADEAGEPDSFGRDADDGASSDAADEGDGDAAAPSARPSQRGADGAEPGVATQLGSLRFVAFGFLAAWLVGAYVAGKALEGIWGSLGHREWFTRALPAMAAVPYEGELISRSSISLVVGALLAGIIVFVYYRKPDVRQWADEVAEQLSKVKWPTRKEVGNNTIVVIAVGAVLGAYLAILDRFWGFLTNLFYSSGL
jgi:preprotein translocase subunit SecE